VKDISWKETAGETDAIGLVINIVSGKPLSLFLLYLAMEGTSVFVVIQIWRQHFRVLTNDYMLLCKVHVTKHHSFQS